MGGKIVQNYDGSGFQGRCELGLDICLESKPVHCACDHPRRNQRVLGQPRNEGLRAPFSKGRGAIESFALERAPTQPGEIGFDGGFIDKHQPVRFLSHAWLATIDPLPSRLAQGGTVTLLCDKPFFYMRNLLVPKRGELMRVERICRTYLPTHLQVPAMLCPVRHG